MGKIKKVLMISDPGMDHLAYMMFDGLYKVLGKENLVLYPDVKHYHGEVDEYILDNGQKWHSVPLSHMSRHDCMPERSFDDLACNMDSFDVIYLSCGRTYARKNLDAFIERCGKNNIPPIIFSEGEDYQSLDTVRDMQQMYNPIVSFKRELIPSELRTSPELQPLYPLPFSAIVDKIPQDKSDKDIDVFALFGNTNPIREKIVRLINSSKLSDKYNVHVHIDRFSDEPEKVPWHDQARFSIPPLSIYSEYLSFMSRAKINIVARGWGNDTLRRFEAACFSGLVMSDNIPIITPFPFIEHEHIIYYDNDLNNLIKSIKYYLENMSERERIGAAGRKHCLKYHTTEARAGYFLRKAEQHLP